MKNYSNYSQNINTVFNTVEELINHRNRMLGEIVLTEERKCQEMASEGINRIKEKRNIESAQQVDNKSLRFHLYVDIFAIKK